MCVSSFSKHAPATKMNTNNLALVFGPTLLTPPGEVDAITLARYTSTINMVILTMVENRHEILGKERARKFSYDLQTYVFLGSRNLCC